MGVGGTKRARRAREEALTASLADAAAASDAQVRATGSVIDAATPSASLFFVDKGGGGTTTAAAAAATAPAAAAAAATSALPPVQLTKARRAQAAAAAKPRRSEASALPNPLVPSPTAHMPRRVGGVGSKAARRASLAAAAVMDEGGGAAAAGPASRPRKAARVGGVGAGGVGGRRGRRGGISGMALATRIRSATAVWDAEPPPAGCLPAPPSASESERAAAAAAAAASEVDVDWWRRPAKPFSAPPDAHPVLARARVRGTVVAAARADALSVNPLRSAHQDALGEAVAAELLAADADAAADEAMAFSAAAAVPALTVDAGVGASAGAVAADAAADAAAAEEDGGGGGPISINPAVVAAKKTRTERNKEARRRAEAAAAARRAAAAAETELLRGLPTLVARADAAVRRTAAVTGREGGRLGRRAASRAQHLPRLGGRRLPRLAAAAAAAVPLSADLAPGGGVRALALPPVERGLADAYLRLQAGGLVEVPEARASTRGRVLDST
ncbi:hypothetical protein I4F81_012726 [Pyropia yezoensis]|uniref:Uncharacterized protein n=1 Tax=Pyropia yezoensis TaxID=2788 RepID=A0ACC3CK47_PYRYE|nr:hypothetical protein I4F81_012726 [Neopyropia yezoensis]